MIILGIDPGETTGFCMLECLGQDGYIPVLGQMKGRAGTAYALELLAGRADAIAVEGFVVGRKSMRGGSAGNWTRTLIGLVKASAIREGIHGPFVSSALPYHERSASEVKAWATDRRLDALRVERTGLPHGADALRHALFSAVKDFGRPDPLNL